MAAQVNSPARPARRLMSNRSERRAEMLVGLLFAAPVVLGTLLFNYIPMVASFVISFTKWDGSVAPVFVGLNNYTGLFGANSDYLVSLNVTTYYMLGSTIGAMIVGLILALLVNLKLKGIDVFRGLYFLPVVTSVIAIAMVWRFMFNPQFGPISSLLALIGIESPDYLRTEAWALPAVIVVDIWARSGYNMVLFLAGLQGVPAQLQEAASIDGAGVLAKFRHVTLPLLTPTIFFVAIISVIRSFEAFGLIYVMTNGGPGLSTTVYVFRMWERGFRSLFFGEASAMSYILFVIIAGATAIQWWASSKWVYYG